jgi:hypothetical protein
MSDTTLNRFLASGTTAARLAFTPSPPTPASGPNPGYFWFDTDDSITYSWDGAAWVAPPGSGTVTHTGTLTSGDFITGNGGADITAVTPTAATALLDDLVGDSGSGGTKGLAPAPAAGDAAAGKFLKADATWAVPAGGGGGWTLIQSQTASGSANLEFTGISSTYDNYAIVFEVILAQTSGANFTTTLSDASGYFSAAYQWTGLFLSTGAASGPGKTGSTSDSAIHLFDGVSNTNGLSGTMFLIGSQRTSGFVATQFMVGGFDSGNHWFHQSSSGMHALTQAVTKIKFAFSTGNITSGTIKLYGIEN